MKDLCLYKDGKEEGMISCSHTVVKLFFPVCAEVRNWTAYQTTGGG